MRELRLIYAKCLLSTAHGSSYCKSVQICVITKLLELQISQISFLHAVAMKQNFEKKVISILKNFHGSNVRFFDSLFKKKILTFYLLLHLMMKQKKLLKQRKLYSLLSVCDKKAVFYDRERARLRESNGNST